MGGDKRIVASGWETTFRILERSENEAADRVLISALDCGDPAVQARALRALLERGSASGQREVLRRWPSLDPNWKAVIAERPGRVFSAVRDALLSSDAALRIHGCDAALHLGAYELVPVLIAAAEDKTNLQADLAAGALLSLSERLYEEVCKPRDYRKRRDPKAVREHVVAALEASVQRFEQHRRGEIVEAFLLLASRDNSLLKRLLRDPHDKAYLTAVNLLTHSSRPGVWRLLVRSLKDADAPSAILGVLARRRDLPFLRYFLGNISTPFPPAVKLNLKRIEWFTWLRDDLSLLSRLEEAEQRVALQMALASGMNRLDVFQVVEYLFRHGKSGSRRDAGAALVHFRGAEVNHLLLEGVRSGDAAIQAAVAGQLRSRGIPNALALLVELIDSPHEAVRQAARESLSEFRLARFLETYDMLDEETRARTGQLVKRVDPDAVAGLAEQLRSTSRTRRVRGVAMAVAMGAVQELEDELAALLTAEDQYVRAEVLRLLAPCDSPKIRDAVRELLRSESAVVQKAAEEILQSCGEAASPGALTKPVPAPLAPHPADPTPLSTEN